MELSIRNTSAVEQKPLFHADFFISTIDEIETAIAAMAELKNLLACHLQTQAHLQELLKPKEQPATDVQLISPTLSISDIHRSPDVP